MEIFEAYTGMYRNKYLPEFAQFILDNHLNGYVEEQIRLGRKVNIPLLKSLSSRFKDHELVEVVRPSTKEYLTYLSQNRGAEQIAASMEKWLEDQLQLIGKFEIVAEDITLMNYIRQQSHKKFIPLFTNSIETALELTSEIDTLLLGANTTATDIYVNILKNKIEEESNFRKKLIEASPAITFVFDLVQNKEVFISGKLTGVMGYRSEELSAMGNNILLQLVHPDDLPFLTKHLQELGDVMDDEIHQAECRFRHKDGQYRWLRIYQVVFKRDEIGKPVELLGKMFEATQEKKTALALQQRERQLLEAQSLAHIGSYEWNMKERYSVNTAEVFRIFEMDKGQKFEEFMLHVHPDDVQKVTDMLQLALKTGNYECEYRYLKNGKEKVIWSLGKVDFEGNLPTVMVGTVQDITEIKRMERELIEKTKELQNSNESLQQFAFIASHDLKEPLRKINMFTDMVVTAEGEKLSAISRKNLTKVQKSSEAMQRMVDDILSLSLLEDKQGKQPYSLQNIVAEVVELLDQSIVEKEASIIYHQLPEACIIPSQFRQLFQNLLSNSLKFSRKEETPQINIDYAWRKDRISEALKPASKYLQLTIRDNGIGFSNDSSDQIFELFKRLHSKSQYEGSGLGLAISKKIVENHEGIIKAESETGKGAIFTISIPQ